MSINYIYISFNIHILPLKIWNPHQFFCPLQLLFLDRVHIGIFKIKSCQLDTVSSKFPGYKNTYVSITESAEIVHFVKRPCLSSCNKAFEGARIFQLIDIVPVGMDQDYRAQFAGHDLFFNISFRIAVRVGTDDFRLATSVHQDSSCSSYAIIKKAVIKKAVSSLHN